MPAGRPWLQRPYRPARVPTANEFFHVFKRRFGPLATNPWSEGRFALAPPLPGESSDFGMFYVATSLAGALWEVPLRDVQPDLDRTVALPVVALDELAVVRLELLDPNVPLIDLRQPGLRDLFPDVDSDEAHAIAGLCTTGNYEATHREAWGLQRELTREGHDMPFLAWGSRMHSGSTVYLGYAPPADESFWRVIDDPVDLDGPAGHELVRRTLADAGFEWVRLEDASAKPNEDPEE